MPPTHKPDPNTSTKTSWRIILVASIASILGVVLSMAAMRIDRSRTAEAAAANLRNLWPFWIASGSGWLALTAMWHHLSKLQNAQRERTVTSPSDVATSPAFGRSAIFIMAIAVAARVAVLITHRESLSDDVYRYIYDGRNVAAAMNPYLQIPAECVRLDQEHWRGEKQLLPLITYPELATPYLPVSQAVFGALGLSLGEGWSDPESSARVFRTGFVLIEVAMMLVLLAALRRAGTSPWWMALYAWHPLPLSEFAGSGHQDIIGIAFLVACLFAFSAAPAKAIRWSALLALSAMGKPFTLPTGAILLRGRPISQWIWSLCTGAAVALIALAPCWLIFGDGGRAFENWRATADELAAKFAHFGGGYEPVLAVVRIVMPADGRPPGFNLEQEWLARKICFGALIVAGIMIWRSRLDAWNATRGFLFALVLLTTTAHPWYLLWAFALVPLANSWAMWMLSLTLPWGYVVFAYPDWKIPLWLVMLAYAPVFAALAIDLGLRTSRFSSAKPQAV